MKRKITDKKLNNKRFWKTEKALIGAFFSERRVLTARVIIKRAKISRSTFHRHHKTIYDIVPDYEEYIMQKYDRLMRKLLANDNIKLKTIYCQILVFIMMNRWVFEVLLNGGNERILEKMMKKVEKKARAVYKLTGDPKNTSIIYEKELAGVLEIWIKDGVSENEMSNVLSNMLCLTDTFKDRVDKIIR